MGGFFEKIIKIESVKDVLWDKVNWQAQRANKEFSEKEKT
jgi:hypothetical protein